MTSNETQTDIGQQRPEDLYVVTENGEQCFLWRSNQLTYIAQDRDELPAILASKFGHLATRLDLSYNSLTSFKYINSFTQLNELILDNNLLEDNQLNFTPNLRLKTLSLNKNKLTNLYKLVSTIKVCLPNLEYLSLIGNPLCPGSQLVQCAADCEKSSSQGGKDAMTHIDELVLDWRAPGGDQTLNPLGPTTGRLDNNNIPSEFSQQKYRHFIIYHLPNLRFLDSSSITANERDEALRRCFWMSQATLSQLNQQTSGPALISNVVGQQSAARQCRHRSENSTSSGAENDQTDEHGEFRLTIMSGGTTPWTANEQSAKDTEIQPGEPSSRAIFSRLAYKYTGKNSEGNRFIRNQDL